MKIYDFLIIGSGISGQTLALRLARSNYKVLIVEKGNKDLNFHSTCYTKDSSLVSNKINYIEGIGGSVNLWAGRLMALNLKMNQKDEILVDTSKSYCSIKYLNLAIKHLKYMINDKSLDLSIDDFASIRDNLSGLNLIPAIWLRKIPRCNTKSKIYKSLSKDRNVTIRTDYDFIRLIWENDKVIGAEFKSGLKKISFFAEKVIMTSGCNGNIRNLLLDKKYNTNSPLLGHKSIGKYIIEHPIFLSKSFQKNKINLDSFTKPIYEKNIFKQFGLTNNQDSNLQSYVVVKKVLNDFEERAIDSLFNTIRELKRFKLNSIYKILSILFQKKNNMPSSLFYSLPHTSIPRWVFKILKLFAGSQKQNNSLYRLAFHFTVKPDINNYAFIDNNNKLVCKVNLSEELQLANKDIEEISKKLFGDSTHIPNDVKFIDSSHLMGGTRIGLSSSDSVVDSNLKVHHAKNLYVVGSSTFPFFGVANPTLHIIAQALWLSDNIKND